MLIAPGTPTVALLKPTDTVPEIAAGRSVIHSPSEVAPELIDQTLAVIDEVNRLFGPENQAQIERVFGNFTDASETFSKTLEGFSEFSGSANAFATEISGFRQVLTGLSDDIQVLPQNANDTLTNVSTL